MGYCIGSGRFCLQQHEEPIHTKTPFEIVYLSPPHFTLDLVNLPQTPGLLDEAKFMAEYVTKIHIKVTQNLQKANDAYKLKADSKRRKQEFEVGDLVMVFFMKRAIPSRYLQ